ncbi:MAG: hypothetical protein GY829_10630, partial [Gammaproteobacteria bacterium]|nr:hypothetical protein [Gammaproteobacteria bacterium]
MVTNTVSGLNDAQKAAVLDDVIKTEEHRLQYDKDSLEAINQNRYDMNHRIKWMNQVARDVTAAKQNLFQHITAIAQAALPSQTSVYNKSGRPTSTPFVPIKVDFDYHPGNYKDVPTEGVVTEERHLASSEENMIDFEASYTESATATTSQSIFNVLSHMGTINENSHHQRYLREILANIIEKALKPGEEFIVQVGKNAAQNVGDITGNKIRINLAPNRPPITLQQSAEEIYIHELIHGLTTSEIESNSVLRKRLDELFTIARDNLTPSDFLEEDIIENQTLDDQHQAALAAQARYDYIFNNKIVDRTQTGKNRIKGSNGLYEFIAFGLSNETLVKKLQRIPYHQKKADTSTLYEQLVDIFNRVLQFVTEKFRGTFDVEDNVYAQLYRLTEDIVGINEGWRFPVMGFLSGAQIYKQNAEVFITEKLENTRISINRLIADDRSKIGRAVFLLNNTLKAAKHAEVGPFITRFLEKHVENDGFIAGMGRALTGGSDRFKSWLPLLRYSKERIDTARKTAKEGIIKSLKNAFKTEPTDIEKAMLHDIVLKTDILSLLPDNPSNDQILEVLKLVENEQMIDTRIKAILNGLSVDQPTKKYYHNQSNNLGWFMATGKTVLNHANLNAFNIARKALTSETDNKLASSKTVAAIDELASLYALKYTSHNVKNDFVRFVKQELAGNPMENGVKALLTLASSHKKYSATVLFRDEDYNIIKGFANEI